MFPFNAGSSGAVKVEDCSPWIFHFPKLCLVVEFDGCRAGYLQSADLMQVDQLGIEAGSSAVCVKCDDCGIHGGFVLVVKLTIPSRNRRWVVLKERL